MEDYIRLVVAFFFRVIVPLFIVGILIPPTMFLLTGNRYWMAATLIIYFLEAGGMLISYVANTKDGTIDDLIEEEVEKVVEDLKNEEDE